MNLGRAPLSSPAFFLRMPLLVSAVFLICASPALARPVVKLHLSGVLLERSGGSVKQTPVEGVVLKPGQIVRYTITAWNVGDSAALRLMPLGPVPKNTAIVPGSARDGGALVQYTLDGKTWSARPMLAVKTPKGTFEKPAGPALYKAVRWIAQRGLAPHKKFVFTYDVRVNGHAAGK